jgi:hypothetical protein
VTNVGKWWADHTTATVETIAPTRGNKVEEDVLDLDPRQQPQGPTDYKYEFDYRLAAACQPGLKVKASLSTAVTFNGNKEAATDLGNNVDEREPCPNAVPPGGQGGVGLARGPAPGEPTTPQEIEAAYWVKPGEHSRMLDKPSMLQTHLVRVVNEGLLGCIQPMGPFDAAPSATDAQVGYQFFDQFGCDKNNFFQLVVNFDLKWLKDVESKLLGRADLIVGETVVESLNNDGEPIPASTCIGRLSLAPAAITPGQLLGGEEVGARLPDSPGQTRTWNVIGEVTKGIVRDNPPLTGFVLHAVNENLNAESEAACISRIFTVQLKLDYIVLE